MKFILIKFIFHKCMLDKLISMNRLIHVTKKLVLQNHFILSTNQFKPLKLNEYNSNIILLIVRIIYINIFLNLG